MHTIALIQPSCPRMRASSSRGLRMQARMGCLGQCAVDPRFRGDDGCGRRDGSGYGFRGDDERVLIPQRLQFAADRGMVCAWVQ